MDRRGPGDVTRHRVPASATFPAPASSPFPSHSPRLHDFRLPRPLASLALCCATLLVPIAAEGQGDSIPARTHLGLAAVGALTAHASFAALQREYRALGAGATVDFGYIRSPRVRLLADVTYLRTFPRTEFIQAENRSYRDDFRDLSGTVAFAFHANRPTASLSPYVMAGIGVHVLSSSFGSAVIDRRYNTNNYGLLAAAGARLRTGTGGRRALLVEARRVMAHDVGRVSFHLGLSSLFGDLAPR